MSEKRIVLYGTPSCPMVLPVSGILRRAKAPFAYVDISKDPEAKAQVRAINNGNESVPTLLFPDESMLTEPSRAALQAKLREYGYEDPGGTIWDAWRENWVFTFLGVVLLVFAGAAQSWVLAAFGLAFLAYPPISYKLKL
jgi:mycoredoxin